MSCVARLTKYIPSTESVTKLIPKELKNKESAITLAGGLTFAGATAALVYLLISGHSSWNMEHVVAASLVGSLDAAALVTFITGMVLNQRRQQHRKEEMIFNLENAPNVQVDEIEIKAPGTNPTACLKTVKEDLKPLLDGLGAFLKGMWTGYKIKAKTEEKGLDKVEDAVKGIEKQINEFLDSPDEVLRIAVGVSASLLLDETKMKDLLTQPSGKIISGLPEALLEPKKGEETKSKIIRQALQVVAGHADLNDAELIARIEKLKSAYREMSSAAAKDKEAKKLEYQKAITQLVDHLYANAQAKIEPEHLDLWKKHLIKIFLEEWRVSLFEGLDSMIQSIRLGLFNPKGLFNDSTSKSTIGLAYYASDERVKDTVKGGLDFIPLAAERKEALLDAEVLLFRGLYNALYYGLMDKDHAFRKRAEELFDPRMFDLSSVKEKTLAGYSKTYGTYFERLGGMIQS